MLNKLCWAVISTHNGMDLNDSSLCPLMVNGLLLCPLSSIFCLKLTNNHEPEVLILQNLCFTYEYDMPYNVLEF
jgi:hypothetical protein